MSTDDKDDGPVAVHIPGDEEGSTARKPVEAVVMPESLRNKSDEEIDKLRRKMVRKMDMVIM